MNIRLNKQHFKPGRITLIILVVLAGSIFTINSVLSAAEYEKGDLPLDKIKSSPQYVDGKFTNPEKWNMSASLSSFKDYLFGGQVRTPKATIPQKQIIPNDLLSKDSSYLNVVNVGHSSLIIQMDGYRILTDPVYEDKLTPVGPVRFNREIPIDPLALEHIDVVVISHNHYDHLNKFTIKALNPQVKQFIVPLGVGAQLEKWGVSREKIAELDWWESFAFDEELMITATPCQHFSGRGLMDRDKTLWNSYAIASLEHSVYFSGDSGYFDGFKAIGEKLGPFDIAFMECGAYNEAWDFVHMFPEQTVQAAIDVKAHYLWPVHWGTFNLSIHDWFDPMQRVTLAAEANNVRLLTPIFGEIIEYPGRMPEGDWWSELIQEKK